jgi:hypothetical protein
MITRTLPCSFNFLILSKDTASQLKYKIIPIYFLLATPLNHTIFINQ